MQNDIAMSAPAGIAIDIDSLEDVVVDGVKMSPLEILKIRRQTGDYLYRRTDQMGNASNPRPAFDLPGGVGQLLNERIATMQFYVEQIRQITGINEIVDATTPNPKMPVATAKLAVGSTNNILQPLYSAYAHIKEKTAYSSILRLQVMAQYGDITVYNKALGKSNIEVIKIGAGVSLKKFGIKLEMIPTDEMKAVVRQYVMKLSAVPLDQGGISAADAMMIEDQLINGNLKVAQFLLATKEKNNLLRLQEQALLMEQARGQTAMEIEKAKAEALQMKAKAEAERDIAIEQAKLQGDLVRIEAEHQARMEEIALQGNVDTTAVGAKLANQGTIADKKIAADLEKHHTANIKEMMMAEREKTENE